MNKKQHPLDRFCAKYREQPGPLKTPCHVWQGSRNEFGYARFKDGGVNWRAHKWIYVQVNGSAYHGELSHLCHNAACVNPSHLVAESHWENMQRRVA